MSWLEKHLACSTALPGLTLINRLKKNDVALGNQLAEQLDQAPALFSYLEQILHPIGQYSDDVFYLRSADRKELLYVSPNYERIWGYTRASLYQDPESWLRAVHPKDLPKVRKSLLSEQDGQMMEQLFRIIRPGGGIRWIRARSIPMLQREGAPGTVIGICRDITVQRRLNRRRQYLQRQHQAMLKLAEELIVTDNNWQTLWDRVGQAIQEGTRCPGVDIGLLVRKQWQWGLRLGPQHQRTATSPLEIYGHVLADARFCGEPMLWRQTDDQGQPQMGLLHLIRNTDGEILGCCVIYAPHRIPNRRLAGRFLRNASSLLERWINLGQLRRKLVNTEAMLTQFAESVDEVVFVTDGDFSAMDYINSAYQKIWQQPAEALQANPKAWMESIHPEDKERIAQELQDRQTRRQWNGHFRIVRPDGSIRHIQDRTFPVYAANQDTGRVVGVARDITLEHELVERNLSLAKAESAIFARNEVLAFVTHDLRSPLTSLLANAHMLARNLSREGMHEALGKVKLIEQTAIRMGHVLNDLNFIVQLEAGVNLIRQQEPYDPTLHLLQILQDYQGQAKERKITITTALDDNIRCSGVDKFHLVRIVENLISNSLKYTQTGGQLRICLRSQGNRMHLEVADTGPGMGQDILAEIQVPFWQKQAGLRRGNMGMGLSIVHALVRSYDGIFRVIKQPPFQTVVQIDLPLMANEGKEPPTSEPTSKEQSAPHTQSSRKEPSC